MSAESSRSTGQQADGDQEARTPEEIRADIESTREDLGDTVEALAGKTDVKGRAQSKVDEVKGRAQQKVAEVKTAAKDKTDQVKAKVSSDSSDDATASSTGNTGYTGSGGAGGTSSTEDAMAKAQQAGQQAVAKAKENPIPVAAAVALILGYLIGRRVGS